VSGFLFAFLAVLFCAMGARDQLVIARMTRAQGQRPMLLVIALAAAAGTSAFAGWAAGKLAADMAPPARTMFAAFALILSGLEVLVLRPPRQPEEPTGSLFAAFLVLAAQQLTDGARFLVLAMGVATAVPLTAALGGGAASLLALTLGWLFPEAVEAPWLRRGRMVAGCILAAVGLWLGLRPLIG
jgi:hypothetical protein